MANFLNNFYGESDSLNTLKQEIQTTTQHQHLSQSPDVQVSSMPAMSSGAGPATGLASEKQMDEKPLGVNIHTRPMGTMSKRLGAVTTMDTSVICEKPWNLDKMVEKPAIVATFPWTTSMASRTVLNKFNLPFDIYSPSAFMKIPFNSFNFWRGDIELHLQVTGTNFHQGTVIMFYLPLHHYADAQFGITTSNRVTPTTLQHVFLHANAATSACMTIPFINNKMYLGLAEADVGMARNTGCIGIMVFNQLNAASGASTSVDISLMAQFKNSQFKIPIDRQSFFRGEGLIEKLLGEKAGDFVQRMLPANVIADSINFATDMFGLDKPTTIERMPPGKMLGTSYLNSSVDIDYLDKFTLFPSKMQEVDAVHFGVDVDELDVNYLKKKYTFMGAFRQNLTDAAGKVIAMVPLSPTPVPLLTGVGGTDVPISNYIPLIQYMSYPFAFWKGGLTYKLQIVASSFHVGKIFIAIQYGNYAAGVATLPLADASSQYGYAFEINQGSTEFEFTVPYVSPRPQLMVSNSNTINPENCMGMMYITVMNTLSASNNVVDFIEYNMFIAGADNFALSTISIGNGTVYANVPSLAAADIAEPTSSGFSGETSVVPRTGTEFARPGTVLSPCPGSESRDDHSDQSVNSFTQYLKKYHHVSTRNVQITARKPDETSVTESFKVLSLLYGRPGESLGSNVNDMFASPIDYVAAMYGAVRGPVRVKMALRTVPVGASIRIRYFPPNLNYFPNPVIPWQRACASAVDGYLVGGVPRPLLRQRVHTQVINSTQKTAEFEIPYLSPYYFTRLGGAVSNDQLSTLEHDLGSIQVDFFNDPTLAADATEYLTLDTFVALGDETRFGVFIGVPVVNVVFEAAGVRPSPGPDGYRNTQPSPSYFTLGIN